MYHLIFRLTLGDDQRKEFEKIVDYFDENLSPMAKEMTFLLGFYVSNVVKRWWEQYKSLPWPDTLVAISHALVDFNHEDGMKFCQTIMRYSMLSYILCGKYLGAGYDGSNIPLQSGDSARPCSKCSRTTTLSSRPRWLLGENSS